MKTFETEKHNIPEGATHYSNETRDMHFAWRNAKGESQVPSVDLEWMMFSPVREWKPIPQTKEVEWVNGGECNYGGVDGFVVGYCKDVKWIVIEHSGVVEAVNVEHISKPETEAERVERELEAKKAKEVNDMCFAVTSLRLSQAVALYDAGYRKEGE